MSVQNHRNGGVLIRGDGSSYNVADQLFNLKTDFGDLGVVERSNLIEINPFLPLSIIRNIQNNTGAGEVTHTGEEYRVATTAQAGDIGELRTAQRGRYLPGYIGQVGIGVRLPQRPTGEQNIKWGYYDQDQGFYFGEDSQGVFIGFRRNGSETLKVYQENWNIDKLDGTGPSEQTLDVSRGNIFQFEYSCYGYGAISYRVLIRNEKDEMFPVVVHRTAPTGQVSLPNPNLPITITADNGQTAEAIEVFVGGRQYGILGRYEPHRRFNGDYRLEQSLDTTLTPLISFRKKEAFTGISLNIGGFDILGDTDLLVKVLVSPTLTDATFGTPTDTTASETSVETDTAATAITGGEPIYEQLIGVTNQSTASLVNLPDLDIPDREIVTLAARTISGTATISSLFRWREEW